MSVDFRVVIPARYASTRLPGKPLLDMAGKPMIVHVCERAMEAEAQEVIVATDDQRIFDRVSAEGIKAVMTRADHNSGTERIAEVAQICAWDESDIIVNLQGDEPLIPAEYIHSLAAALAGQQQAGIATLAATITAVEEVFNPNAVKVVVNNKNHALYFSRAPIPWDRDGFSQPTKTLANHSDYLRHIGMYAYRVGFLKRYIAWSISPLETIESLEQLRILWNGESILVKKVSQTPEAGVDTEADFNRVVNVFKCKQ
jgi:3-deoxy-manno-octulosonate cytidylyltransferase (CMP-KDO synthetase)